MVFIFKRNIVHTRTDSGLWDVTVWGNFGSADSFGIEISSVSCGFLGFVVIRLICVNNS